MFRLALNLRMTVRELCERMDSAELSEWIAYTTYYEALPDPWRETGLLTSAILAPHSPKGKTPKAEDFVPLDKPPQHEAQVMDALMELRRALGQTDDG
jgi:hypothetical protein